MPFRLLGAMEPTSTLYQWRSLCLLRSQVVNRSERSRARAPAHRRDVPEAHQRRQQALAPGRVERVIGHGKAMTITSYCSR